MMGRALGRTIPCCKMERMYALRSAVGFSVPGLGLKVLMIC